MSESAPGVGSTARRFGLFGIAFGSGFAVLTIEIAGARLIAGVDPTLVYFMQHQAINHYVGSARNWVVPLTFEALPQAEFDVVLSMGVIYHRRQPIQHVQQLYTFTRPGGEVLLESLVVSDPFGLEPNGRYDERFQRHNHNRR